MRRLFSVFVLCFVISNNSWGQGIEVEAVKIICKEIAAQNENYSLKQKLKGKVYRVVDPIANKENLRYEDTSDITVKQIIRRYSREILLKKLSDYDFQVRDVNGKYIITDSANIFSNAYLYSYRGNSYLLRNERIKEQNSCKTAFFGIRNDFFYIMLSVPGLEDYLSFQFRVEDNQVKFVRKSLVPKKPHY